jgi:hypothetical protein
MQPWCDYCDINSSRRKGNLVGTTQANRNFKQEIVNIKDSDNSQESIRAVLTIDI